MYYDGGGGLLLQSQNYVGFLGQNATNSIAVATGGGARVSSITGVNPVMIAETTQAGNGSVPPMSVVSTGGGGANASGYLNNIYAGDGGNGGNDGDYAINGNSFIVWENIGTIYGAIT